MVFPNETTAGSRLIATLHEWKNPIVIFCFGILIGCTFYFQDIKQSILTGFCSLLLIIFIASRNSKIILLLLAIVLSFGYNIAYSIFFTSNLSEYLNKECIYIGEIASKAEDNRFYKRYELKVLNIIDSNKNDSFKIKNPTILINGSKYEEYEVGDIVQITGNLKRPKTAILPGLFNEKQYLLSKGISYLLKAKNGTLVFLDAPKSTIFAKTIYKLREKLLSINKTFLAGERLSIVNGIIFGAKASPLEGKLKDKVQSTGLSHITSASGFNVSILAAGIFALFRLFNYRKKLIPTIICLFAVLTYSAIADFSPSIIRATIFIIFLLVGNLFDKRMKTLPGISLIVIGFFIANPMNLLDIGLQLSILGFLGLDLFANEALKDNKNWLLSIFHQSLFAQIMVLPLIVFYFHNIQLLGLISNLAAAPLASLILITGLINLAVNKIPIINNILERILFYLSDFFIQWVNFLNNFEYKQIFLSNIDFYILIIMYMIIFILLSRLFITISNKVFIVLLATLATLLIFTHTYTDSNKYFKIFFIPSYNQDTILILPPKERAIYLSTNSRSLNLEEIKSFLTLNNIPSRIITYNLKSNLPATFPSNYIKNDRTKITVNYGALDLDIIKDLNKPIESKSEYIKLPLLNKKDPPLNKILKITPQVSIINDYKKLSKKSMHDIQWLKSQSFKSLFLSETGTISLISNGKKTFLITQED